MQRITLIIIILFINFEAISQSIVVKSFKKLENDQDARIAFPKTDQNGKKCAIIKVVTSQTGFNFDFGMIGNAVATEQKIGEIWVWVPSGARKVTISHQLLGVLREHQFDLDIEEATAYEMVLTTGKVTTTVEEQIGEWVVITSEPSGADVYIDEKATGRQTPFTGQYTLGAHSYRLSLDLYYNDAGKFELTPNGGKKAIGSKLKPTFGQLVVNSLPENGAAIELDGKELVQTTPFTIEKIKSGTHSLTLSKNLYYKINQTITISDAKTDTANIVLKAAFGSITISSTPESEATVTLDDTPTGLVTPCTLEKVPSGVHTISLRKEWYQPVKKLQTISDDEKVIIAVPMDKIFGTVNITTTPGTEIYIDSLKMADGTFTGRLNEGIHTIEGRKPKYNSDIQKLQIMVGDQKNIFLAPRAQLGKLEIQSTPIDATITLNGEEKGTTPVTLRDLLVGDYSLKLSLPNYTTFTKTITITEGITTQVNETLIRNQQENIVSPIIKAEPIIQNQPSHISSFSKSYYKYKKRKNFWLVSALVSGSAGVYSYLQAGKYYTQYHEATTDAAALHSKVQLFDLISPVAFGAAGLFTLEFIIQAGKQSKAKKQSISFYPQRLNHGVGLSLLCSF